MPRITSWLEVEKRLANYNNQIKSAEDRLVKTNDSINAFLNALVLNLKDLLESQSDISLWFYDENEPTTSNLPYTSWTTPSDHYGDFFYSRTKGLVFQFTSNGWVKLEDATMLNAMALTNSKLGANDHERKVFLDNPTTPYTSGDWWIREDGTLYICQLSRASGKREENDFIDALNYAQAVAKATDNIVEVLKGTLITTTDSAVVYEDKATHKTTTISGDSIRTGELISNNYVPNSKGTKISLNDGTIDSKNFKVSNNGTITATNGNFSGTITSNNATLTGGEIKSSNYVANTSGTKINLSNGTIDSKNFKVNSQGNMTCSGATIKDGRISLTDNGEAGGDNYFEIIDWATPPYMTSHTVAFSNDVETTYYGGSSESKANANIYANTNSGGCSVYSDKYMGGLRAYTSTSNDPDIRLSMSKNNTNYDYNVLATDNDSNWLYMRRTNKSIYGYVGDNGTVYFSVSDGTNTTTIRPTGVTQPSLAESKEDFEKLTNGLEIIKDIDIYKYYFKNEEKDAKKHIGFVIGKDFKYREDITSQENDGVDIYAFVSVCCKAIQEQQEQIEDLKEQLEELKNK